MTAKWLFGYRWTFVACTVTAIAGALAARRFAHAGGVPATNVLTYSGRLENSAGDPITGVKNIAVAIYNVETAGTKLCESTATAITIGKDGSFQVQMPDACVAPIHANATTWIEVSVDGAPVGRSQIGAVPYALEADTASKATGALAGQVVPAGMIAMFAGACPTGWTEYTAMRGRFPRGETTGAGASLDQGGSDDLVVPTHTHTATSTVSTAGDHTHAFTTSTEPDHSHQMRARKGPNGTHGHSAWTDTIALAPDNTDGFAGTPVMDFPAGAHAHTGTTGTGGGHVHTAAVTVATSGVSGTGMNVPRYQELIFCRKS